MRALRPAITALSGSPAAYLLGQDHGSEAATIAADSTALGATTVVAPLQDVGQQAASSVETASVDSVGHKAEAIFRAAVMDSEAVMLSTVAVGSTEAEAEAEALAVEVATAVDVGNVPELNSKSGWLTACVLSAITVLTQDKNHILQTEILKAPADAMPGESVEIVVACL